MNAEYYVNSSTGEATTEHYIAMEWFRAGDNVTLYARGTARLTWEH